MLSTNFVKKNCNYRWFDYEGSYQSLRDEKIVAETGAENKEVISPSSFIKFTVIRNPYDWLVSALGSKWGGAPKGVGLPKAEVPDLVRMYCLSQDWNIPLLHKFIYHQLFDDYGNSCCDYAIIYDKIEEGINSLCSKYKLHRNKRKIINSRAGNAELKPDKKKNYKEYYDDELISLVNKKCHRELDMFKFDFDGYNGDALINISKLKINWNEILSETS